MKIIANSNLCPITALACGEVFRWEGKYFMVVNRICGIPKDQFPVVNLETGVIRNLEAHDIVELLPDAAVQV